MTETPAPAGRPRTVVGAFYCWVGAAVLTAAVGLLMFTVPDVPIRVVGGLLVLVGLALGLLADRARKGDVRFAQAALGLAMASVAFLALVLMFLVPTPGLVVVIAVTMGLLIAGSVLNRRPASQAWFDREGAA